MAMESENVQQVMTWLAQDGPAWDEGWKMF